MRTAFLWVTPSVGIKHSIHTTWSIHSQSDWVLNTACGTSFSNALWLYISPLTVRTIDSSLFVIGCAPLPVIQFVLVIRCGTDYNWVLSLMTHQHQRWLIARAQECYCLWQHIHSNQGHDVLIFTKRRKENECQSQRTVPNIGVIETYTEIRDSYFLEHLSVLLRYTLMSPW